MSLKTSNNLKSNMYLNRNKHLLYNNNKFSRFKITNLNTTKQVVENPEEYIRKMFGKNFDFTQEYLKSNIDPALILKAIKMRYNFKKVNKVTLKHVLYEGARANNILRINDYCFEKMVENLSLPLDDEDEDYEENLLSEYHDLEVNLIEIIAF